MLAVLEDAVSAGAIVGFEKEDEEEAAGGIVAERCGAAGESRVDADLDGPSRAATCAECAERVTTKDLYWYLASRGYEPRKGQ